MKPQPKPQKRRKPKPRKPRWLALTRRAGSTRYDALLEACELLASVYGSRPKALLAIAEASPLYDEAVQMLAKVKNKLC